MTDVDWELIAEGSAYKCRAIAATALEHFHADEVRNEARRVFCPPHNLPTPLTYRRVA